MIRQDTIAAIATPLGMSGIGIIRMSGCSSLDIAKRVFRPSGGTCTWKSHHLYHGDIVSSDGKTILDEVLISFMAKPRSFTGEDVIEINCHGNPFILEAILDQLQETGCRLARPGEFSERAFLNNRMDLSQAEALATMISAKTKKACTMGLSQLKGSLSRAIDQLRSLLIDSLALLESAIDFSEDTAGEHIPEVPPQIHKALGRMEKLLASYRSARAYTEGVQVTITGRTNVGKSSLLNALTGKRKAIVTDIPGTTRDLIEDTITIGGICVRLIDTAGIRKPQDIIEEEGISLVWETLAESDIVLMMLDASQPLTDEDHVIMKKNASANIIVAMNKIDLPPVWEKATIEKLFPRETPVLKISAKSGTGLEELKKTIMDLSVGRDDDNTGREMMTNLRHKQAMEKAYQSILNARDSISSGMSGEFAAFDLREAVDSLDEITGKKISDEILDRVFSSFCIGK